MRATNRSHEQNDRSDSTIDAELETFLTRVGIVSQEHSGTSLAQHLIGTASLLDAWDLRSEVVLAGLIHSIYGTEYYQEVAVPTADRERVRGLVGYEAERLAYMFGIMDRESLYRHFMSPASGLLRDRLTLCPIEATDEELVELAHLALANWFEQRHRAPQEYRHARRQEFVAMRPYLSPEARKSVDEAYGISARG